MGNTLSGEDKMIFELLSLMQPSGVINWVNKSGMLIL